MPTRKKTAPKTPAKESPKVTEECQQLLASLKLTRMQEILEEELKQAINSQPSYQEFLARLLRSQLYHSKEKKRLYRLKNAKIPEILALETFPFDKQPTISKSQIHKLTELDFITKAENIVLIGDTGVGKTGLATGLLLKAIDNGYRGQYIMAQDLFDELYTSLADRSTRKLLNRLSKIDLLLIDEMGYLNLKPEQTNIFFKLMEERYNKKATIITTNLEFTEWKQFLGQKNMVDALLDRIRHRCHTIRIEGASLREPVYEQDA